MPADPPAVETEEVDPQLTDRCRRAVLAAYPRARLVSEPARRFGADPPDVRYYLRGEDVSDGDRVIEVTYLVRLDGNKPHVQQVRARRYPDGCYDTLPPEDPA